MIPIIGLLIVLVLSFWFTHVSGIGCTTSLTRVLLFDDVGVLYICTFGSLRLKKDGESFVPMCLVAKITCNYGHFLRRI